MLYRDPNSRPIGGFLSRTTRFFRSFALVRRRRMARIDVITMNPHLKRDLGLMD